MGFEYDTEKSIENRRKHGIDFEEAQALGGPRAGGDPSPHQR
jgi:uncharacterized DUF497 family protein